MWNVFSGLPPVATAALLGFLTALASPLAAQDRPPSLPINCADLPTDSPHPRDIGLSAALAHIERRELTRDRVSFTLDWASREPDSAYIPVLKRIVEVERCSPGDVALAFHAIEAAGEPSAYFLAYVLDDEHDDAIAYEAILALGVRADTTVREILAEVGEAAPFRGRRGADLRLAWLNYQSLLRLTARLRVGPTARAISFVAGDVVPPVSRLVRGAAGQDSLALVENESRSDAGNAARRRLLRELSQAYPSAVNDAITVQAAAYVDTLAAHGEPAAHGALFLAAVPEQTRGVAFSALASRAATVTSATITPQMCVEDRGSQVGYAPDGLAAVLSYTSAEPVPVRVEYGLMNTAIGPPGTLSPEVFFPGNSADAAPGRETRVAFRPGETVTWTLLGQTVTASEASPRCAP